MKESATTTGTAETTTSTVASLRSRLKALTVGDDWGLVVFLSTIVSLVALWRIGIFLTDNVTVANTLINVLDGRLAIVDSPYGLTAGSQPGLVNIDGQLYGRNYGQVFLAVPLVWLLDLATTFVDLRLLLAAGWSTAILALTRTVASLRQAPRVRRLGSAVALLAFLAALPLATSIESLSRTTGQGPVTPIVALQLVTVLVTSVTAVALYRLVDWTSGRRIAVASGLAVPLATPLGFWGTIPKRHAFVAATFLVVCYWFARSRRGTGRAGLRYRAAAYGVAGFLASVHPFEAVFLLAMLVGFDALTAPSTDRRAIGVLLAVFLVGLSPFVLTNLAITGNPVEPPNIHPDAQHGDLPMAGDLNLDRPDRPNLGREVNPGEGSSDDDSQPTNGESPATGGGSPIDALVSTLAGAYASLLWVGSTMMAYVEAGLAQFGNLDRLVPVFVRSGWIPDIQSHVNEFETIDMALLEALPIAGGIIALPAIGLDRLRQSRQWRDIVGAVRHSPTLQTEVFAGSLIVTFFVVYLPLMPNNSLITLRYVVPVMPLFVFLLARMTPVQEALTARPSGLAKTYLGAAAVGLSCSLFVLASLDLAVGEAVQFHALLNLGTALVLAAVLSSWPVHRRRWIVSGMLGTTAGVTTAFIVLASILYFPYDTAALDLVRVMTEVLPHVN